MSLRRVCGVGGYVLCALSVVVSGFGGEARGQIFYDWANPAGGSYHTPSNWFPSGVPNTLSEGAGFGAAGTYNVFFTSDVTAGEAEVSAGTVTFDLNAGGTKRTYNVASLSAVGTGHLVIDDGTVNAGNVLVQNSARITIAGPDSVLGGELLVSGNINVNGGSLIDERTSFSTPFPPSNVTVQNGGTYKGRLGGGTNTVAGAGSTFSTTISIGTSAALNVHSGAAYIGSIVFIDSVTVTGAGSSLTTIIGTGERRTSVLNILDGAYMDSPSGSWIGVGNGGNGVVTVEGVGSRLTTHHIWIGSDPHFYGMGESGRLTIGGGAAVKAYDITVALAYPDGLIQLQDGGTLEARSVVIPASEEFEWTGGTLHLERFEGLLINEGGTLAPGTPLGITAVTGSYFQFPDAVLEIELGPPGTQHDAVTVSNRATLYGQLKLGLLTGFTATPQQTFTIFQAGTVTGNLSANFSNIANGQRLETADGLGSFLVHFGAGSAFNPNHIVLSGFQASLPGDLNGDGFVGIADLSLVLSNWNQNVPPANLLADPSGDGFVGIADLNLVLGNWNAGVPPGAGVGAPEPGTLAMSGLIVGLWTISRKRRRG